MNKRLLFTVIAIFLTKSVFAFIPAIECRFAALKANGRVALDEIVGYTLDPELVVSGDFEPYGIEISVVGKDLTIGIYVEEEPVSGIQIPIRNIINLPLGGTIFGMNTIFHDLADGFVSMRYECQKVN